MLREIYLTLKSHLSDTVEELKLIDWDLGQYDQQGNDHVRSTPGAYIRFNQVDWATYNRNIQRGLLAFDVTLVNQSAYGDDKDMTDVTYINHLAIERAIYVALQNNRFAMNNIPEWPDEDDENILIETIERTGQTPHSDIDNLIVTTQQFRATVFDYSAHPAYITHLANLVTNISLHKNLDDE